MPVAAPTLTVLSPARGELESTVALTLTGVNYTSVDSLDAEAGLDVACSGAGVSVTNVTAVSDTKVTCDLVITSDAPIGLRYITILHDGGDSGGAVSEIGDTLPWTFGGTLPFTIGYPSDFLVFFG